MSGHSVSQTVTIYDSGDGICLAKMVGGVVTVSCDMIPIAKAREAVKLGTLPKAMWPRKSALGTAYARGIDCYGQLTVSIEGDVTVWCSVTTSGYFGGCVAYPV